MPHAPQILVSGLVNIETTLRIDGFPLPYYPVTYPFHGVHSSVSGVGVNIAKALTRLGAGVRFLSIIGKDQMGTFARHDLSDNGISVEYLVPLLAETAQSVILYDSNGRRQIHVDLKDIQETEYPEAVYKKAIALSDFCCLCNINFSRRILHFAQEAGKPIATDVHVLSDPADTYNHDFMANSEILFLSNERLWASPEECAAELMSRYSGILILVIGLGCEGALLLERGRLCMRVPALTVRPIINTIGAGDALFSSFVYSYANGLSPIESLKRAILFASYKIGEKGAAEGFLTSSELNALYQEKNP